MPQQQIVPQIQFDTLENFVNGMNNYWAHFLRDNPFGESRRNKSHFLRFQEQNSVMEKELTDKVTEVMTTTRKKEELPLGILWDSYKCMSQLVYAEDPGVMTYSDPDQYLIR